MRISDTIVIWIKLKIAEMSYKVLLAENKRLKAEEAELIERVAALQERCCELDGEEVIW